MNNPNPFLSQGVFLEQKNKARNRLRIAVYSSISLSVLVLMVLLFQGCKKPAESADNGNGSDTSTNTQLSNVPPETGTSNTPPATNLAPETNVPVPPVVSTPPPVTTPPPPPVAEMQEYTIVKGDTYATIHNNFKVSVKAIMDANPGVDPKKLKVGQKIKIPAATSSTQSTSVSPTPGAPQVDTGASGGAITYKVKSNDTLTGIAKHYHVSIKAIQSANNLTTTSIKVGQVLKIPGTAAPESAPVPAPSPAPAPVTTAPAPMH